METVWTLTICMMLFRAVPAGWVLVTVFSAVFSDYSMTSACCHVSNSTVIRQQPATDETDNKMVGTGDLRDTVRSKAEKKFFQFE